MAIAVFIALSAVLAYCDAKSRLIPNLIVLPGIALGYYFVGNWIWSIIMFAIGAILFKFKIWRGGDVKLLAMVGMFLGWYSIIVFALTVLAIKVYRHMKWEYGPIAVAPIMCFVSFVFLALYYATKAII